MVYKALGWFAWRAIRYFMRRRFGPVVTKRNAAIAGGTAAAGGAAIAGTRAVRS